MSNALENQIKMTVDEANVSTKKPLALCVDDEETNLEILQMHLKKAGVNSVSCISGDEALEYLQYNEKPDVILLDIMMPGKDGIEVLKILKSVKNLSRIPIILQTAIAQEEKTIEGIESGAYYYITKPYSHNVLISIVKSAIKEKRESEQINDEVINLFSVIENINSCTFEIRDFIEARKLARYLARFSIDPKKYVVGLTALLTNAIEHGNLELNFEEKNRLLMTNTYDEEIEKRQNSPLYKNRKVMVELYKKEKEGLYSVVIKDEGKGFNWEDYIDFDPTRMTDPNGRGIAMANIMNPGGVEYWGRGNVVIYKMPMADKENQSN